jgi:crossover junction endodeoxyribonuclease RusA
VTLKFHLPPAPPLNNAYRNVRGHGRIKTTRYKAWIVQADGYYTLQRLGHAGKIIVPFQCTMRFPVSMRSDMDGRAKLILDWMVKRDLTIDDKHCRRLVLEDGDHEEALVQIEVVPYASSQDREPRPRSIQGEGRGPLQHPTRGDQGTLEG